MKVTIGLIDLLGVLFVALKLTHIINWSWWWVTAPFWGGLAAAGVFIVIALACMLIGGLWTIFRAQTL